MDERAELGRGNGPTTRDARLSMIVWLVSCSVAKHVSNSPACSKSGVALLFQVRLSSPSTEDLATRNYSLQILLPYVIILIIITTPSCGLHLRWALGPLSWRHQRSQETQDTRTEPQPGSPGPATAHCALPISDPLPLHRWILVSGTKL
ncbi:hypothetical protein BDW62DRAFT_152103 [Aspergillus aurantiobrunneus]